jgi:hypothetical protein
MKDILTFEAEPFEVSFEEEIDLRRESGQYEQEFVISGSGSCTVYVDELRQRTLHQFRASKPREPGIYFIYVNDQIWYVGKAESKDGGIWRRFSGRALALKDLGFKAGDLTHKNIKITWLIPTEIKGCEKLLYVRKDKKITVPPRKVGNARELIPLIEQYFIEQFGTYQRGNYQVEAVSISPGVSITIMTNGGNRLGVINRGFDRTKEVKARKDREDIFAAEISGTSWHSEIESETRITIDSYARQHLQKRARRFPNTSDLVLIQNRINQLLGMNAPPQAVGNYSWYVEVPAVPGAKIILRDNMIRTLLSSNERYPANATLYKIESGRFIRGG